MVTRRKWVIVLALILDKLLGDPPNHYHPVGWMGQAIGLAQQLAPRRGRAVPLLYGGLVSIGGALTAAELARLWSELSNRLPVPLCWLLEASALKMTISPAGLDRAAHEVEAALLAGDLPEARRRLSWHLVSRNTNTLTEYQVAAATIESVAENTSDGTIGPLVYYALGGLPAAFAYRFANTVDSMLGYRDAAREWLGKIPAHLDDMLNVIPARLTALLFIASSMNPPAWMFWRRDATRTESPNAGHPMSAMAGALAVELEKIDHYTLGKGLRHPETADIQQARKLMLMAIGLFVTVLIVLPGKRKHG